MPDTLNDELAAAFSAVDSLIAEQVRRERRASDAAQAKRLRELTESADAGSIDLLPASKILIARMFSDMMRAIEAEVQKSGRGPGAAQRGWVRELPVDVLAVITLRVCIAACLGSRERGVTLQKLAVSIGRRIVREVLLRKAEAANPGYIEAVLTSLKDHNTRAQQHIDKSVDKAIMYILEMRVHDLASETDLLHMGKHCVHAALAAGLLEMHRGRNKKGRVVAFFLPDDVRDLLLKYHPSMSRAPKLPSVAPPRVWTGAFGGGYHTQSMARPLVRVGFSSRPETRLEVIQNVQENTRLLDVVNYLQGIPFCLDPGAGDTLTRIWESGGAVLGLPSRAPLPKPPFPFADGWDKHTASEEELRTFSAWRYQMQDWYYTDRQRISKLAETVGMVRTVRDIAGRRVWFPMYMDFRSRMYYCGEPNPQGADPARSLVFFDEKKPLGERGVFWLKVHIANSFGYDKTRFKDRAAWVDKHWGALSEGAQAPHDSPLYRDCTDAPIVASAAVQELLAAYRSGDPASYRTGIPVHMDATCSGLQHFSAMVRDPVGAKYTNLVDSGGPEKADIYSRVAELAMQQVQRDAADEKHKFRLAALIWRELGIPRSLAKRPVMTYVYGATLQSVTEHCRLHLEELGVSHEAIGNITLGRYMARTLFDAVEAVVPSAAAIMRWLRQRCRAHGRDTPLLWTSPMGFRVSLDIREQIQKRVRVRSCGVEQVVLRELGDRNSGQRIGNSISPNLVHSLDATHMCFTAERMRAAGLSMVAIHDSFGTHPCDVDTLHRYVREAFVQLYTEHNPLQDFLDGIGQDAELPPSGVFDITQVVDSEFFFC